jgi:hypothetical protein
MSRRLWALPVVVALAIGGSVAVAQGATTLNATVGPGFTIGMKKGSSKVTSLRAGSYTIKVSDKSNIHNFHLTGPGVNKSTSVPKRGNATWILTLKKGTYRYSSDGSSKTNGSFTVA